MWLQKISILSPQKGLEIPEWGVGGGGVGGSQRPKNLSKCMKLDQNFQRGGGGGLSKNHFCGSGGGMENFWNHTIFFSTYWSCTLQIINFTIGEIKEKLRFSPIIFGVLFFLRLSLVNFWYNSSGINLLQVYLVSKSCFKVWRVL